jgi:plastocyanin
MLEMIYGNKMHSFALAIILMLSVILTMIPLVSAEDYDVSITDDMKFNPDDLTINVGDTVTWTNNDGMGHTATSTDGPASFDSGNIAAGATWSFTFTEAGTYDYKCNYHSSMTATITVVESDNGDENITVNHVALVDTPPHKEWEWNYSYQVEVSDLLLDVNYTAVILIKLIGDDEWGGLDWWWDDIEGDGDQYNYTISLQRECYFINASLYESGDLNSNVENATVLASAYLDFVVGTGSCVDGVYSENDNGEEEEENEETENNETEEAPDGDSDGISDEDDACPDENASGHDADADGCIDDSDNDGVKNDVDPCPFDSADGCLGNLEGNNETFIEGCTYESAKNYNPDATDDDGSCQYGVEDSPGFGIFTAILSCLIIGFRRKH